MQTKFLYTLNAASFSLSLFKKKEKGGREGGEGGEVGKEKKREREREVYATRIPSQVSRRRPEEALRSRPPSAFKPVQRLEPPNLKLPNPKRAWLNGVEKWTILAEFGVVRALGGVEGPRLM